MKNKVAEERELKEEERAEKETEKDWRKERIISLNLKNILKAKSQQNGTNNYSTFEILSTHIWRCASKARSLPSNQVTKLFTLINGRTKLDPPLQPHLFANVLYATSTVVTIGDLINNPINYGASKIRQTLVKMDNSYLRSAIDYLELRPNLINGPGRGADVYESPNFGIVCWIGLPMYDSDFGWGRPFYVTPVGLRLEGKAYILGKFSWATLFW
ncbi:shikimate O-hydroxycinnamoyltransferase-like [Cannabis sativa]|uniref:shikimate O-hydroxycinnamoyltransferase-like n=1 Tax=Cannabis sativa TaxID=3483 RepID=UPI0029CA8E30|nr:shikimate O-hydroxycinnamoyltransferase-like [Cannabis sativa]